MLDPTNLRNRLEMGRTYFMLKMYEDAELAFKEVLQNPNIPKNVRNNIELYLSRVTKVQQKSFTHATVHADWLYDSNVNYGSLDSQYNTNVGTLLAIHERSDHALQTSGDITNIYDIGEKNGFTIKNKFVGFMKDYHNMEEKDYEIFNKNSVNHSSFTTFCKWSYCGSTSSYTITIPLLIFMQDRNKNEK